MTPIQPFTVWYALGDDTQVLTRVQVLGTAYFPAWGRYVLYRQIDWPSFTNPSCTLETTFLALYTPQESPPCATLPIGNSFYKTSWHNRPSWFTKLRRRFQALITPSIKP